MILAVVMVHKVLEVLMELEMAALGTDLVEGMHLAVVEGMRLVVVTGTHSALVHMVDVGLQLDQDNQAVLEQVAHG